MTGADFSELVRIAPEMGIVVILAATYIMLEVKVWTPNREKARKYHLEELEKEREIAAMRSDSMQVAKQTMQITQGIVTELKTMQERAIAINHDLETSVRHLNRKLEHFGVKGSE